MVLELATQAPLLHVALGPQSLLARQVLATDADSLLSRSLTEHADTEQAEITSRSIVVFIEHHRLHQQILRLRC